MKRLDFWALASWVLLLAAAGGSLYVCVGRITSMFGCWRWEITDGREGPNIYALWRVLHGYPLYDSPNRPPYTLTLYNFGFYRFYAALMRLLGANDESLLVWPRVVTAAGGVLGAVSFGRLAQRLAPAEGILERLALAGLCFTLWFGTQFFSWWPFDVRPDIWSLLLALGGLALVSLFMVSMMVKKSAPAPIVMPEVESNEPEKFHGEALAGEAASGEALLDGMELDDDAVKTQQMLDQVSTLVNENPDAAASLVKRWLNRS